jgi:Chitobiase/beta-hexosaminidase C-terminal domain/NHL repeat
MTTPLLRPSWAWAPALAAVILALSTRFVALGSPALPPMDCTVTKYLGTSGSKEVMLNRIVPWAGAHLGGVHVDTSKSPNRFYVFDSANNRILGFYGFRPANPDGSFPPADIVIGQPTLWDHGAANGNNTVFLPPSDRTLALLPFPYVSSTAEAPRSGMMATDSQGNLYVADLCNNRILKFNDPFATDSVADDVWGQTSFTTRSRPATPSASSLNLQWEYGTTIGVFSAGVDVDASNNLWVADSGNNRVLRFPPGSKSANLVLGQSTFTTSYSGTGLNQMTKCTGVRLHPVTGELFVLDGESAPNCRLMIFTPPFSNGQSAARIIGKASSSSSPDGLNYARGFCFDPTDTNGVWVADGGHGRIVKFNTQTGAMVDVIGFNNFSSIGTGNYHGWDGSIDALTQPDGDLGFDSAGNMYFTMVGYGNGIVRVPFPMQRDANGYVISDGQMLQAGFNQISGRTMQDHYGMAYAAGQLYGASGARLLIWTNVAAAGTFQAADIVVGQSSPDEMSSSGTFNGVALNQMRATSNWLFGISGYRIFVFQTPITSGGLNYPPYRILDGGAGTVKWADDLTSVYFSPSGLAYDAASDALWVSDHDHNRLLRIANPTGATPVVNMVIGQTNKTDSAQNHGLGLYATDARGIAAPWSLALDHYGNLYEVDSGFEGRVDNSGNLRVLRFDAASLVPVPNNLFPNPAATGVFCKTNFTDNRNWTDSNRPHTPTYVAFNSANEMVMLCDSYGNPQGQLIFWYPTPQTGLAPQPTQVITTTLGQPATAAFDERDLLIIQDHTWNRYLFYAWSNSAPVIAITNQAFTAPAGATSVVIGGTNRSVTGTMRWQTAAGAAGSFPAANPWSVSVPVSGDATLITILGTNSAGVVASDSITIAGTVLSPPAIAPLGGSFTNSVTVSLLSFATNATIRYTLTGADPDGSSPLYSAPFLLTSNATVKARAFQPGVATSAVFQATFTVQVATPVITPPGGSFGDSVEVSLTCDTPGAQIRYTLDGSEPTDYSPLYSLPIVLEYSTTLKAKAFSPGAIPSATATAVFTGTLVLAATPALAPGGGLFTNAVAVTMSCDTPGAEIRYTTDGRSPLSTSLLYTTPVTLTNSAVVKARAFASGMAGSLVASGTFTVVGALQSAVLPESGTRDRHVALGTDGTNLFFTRGASANAGFYRIPKGAVTGWTTLAPVPLGTTLNGDSGVGDMAYLDGALWTLARSNNTSSARCVYRYDLAANSWTKGATLSGDGPNAAIAVVATNRIFGGWIGWTRIKLITDWQAGVSSDVGDLAGGASHPWDSCMGAGSIYFLKHDNTATNAGDLASLNQSGTPVLNAIGGLPFNPGMGCALEFIPATFFADGHDRLYVLRGSTGSGDGDGSSWTTATVTNQLAIYDLATAEWSLETLPFAVDGGSEMCLVNDTLYILAANDDPQPLKMMVFTQPITGPAAPELQIQLTGADMLLAWPASDSDFTLEETESLPPVSWTAVATMTNQWLVPRDSLADFRCYRLRWP